MTPSLRRVLPAAAAALLAITLAACGESASTAGGAGSADPETLVFASVPSEQSASLQEDYKPILDMLAKETGKKVEFRQATDYAAVIEGQISGQIQIAQYGPLSFVLAQSKGAKIMPVGAQVKTKGEKPGYQSYGITKAGSGITSLKDFAGKKVCFVDPNSTSGFLYPTAGLLEAGVDPKTGITPVMAGGHDSSVLEVKAGRCDAGFAYDTMVDTQLVAKGEITPGEISTVWKSEAIPGSPVAIGTGLSPELQVKLTDAFQHKANSDYLLANKFCTGECKIGDEGVWGYAAVDNAFYDPIRKVCELTKNQNCTEA
ncbi:phosphate/phosphite/phosphonate ABC transporter substrate-binding protein [Pseudonocardia sp. TRM90224]|uniref:phosphate/phosphite/phosphonate ABC transporter substrate-binding protein n=1 Tax=Pseudonocardia sp. TRM90224 TaxID=2812678 RepID=UPI001E62BC65|nr:phosphate/phosphite/phosphonate ABC transporter substrate-binding protein [Pseudonocardia sp. TRM90224]